MILFEIGSRHGTMASQAKQVHTVPFQLIRPSCITGPVVLAEFSHLSHVTTPMADDSWWIQKMVKKVFKQIFMGVGHMQHFFLLIYLRINGEYI